MAKTKEELNAIKEEVEALKEKLVELTEEELEQVTGGYDSGDYPFARS
ncbi:MAG: bacteriocin [Prevotellaceae bacterium]|nr:bacteriocin [Candidatus Faecinaster equi]